MSFVVRFVLAAALPLSLAACGVPDLVAHGVKSYERSQATGNGADAGQQPSTSPPASQSTAGQSTAVRRPPASSAPSSDNDFVPAPAPQREAITAEPLR